MQAMSNPELKQEGGKKPFTISLKIPNYLGINLAKGTKDLCSKHYKALLREIKESLNKQR